MLPCLCLLQYSIVAAAESIQPGRESLARLPCFWSLEEETCVRTCEQTEARSRNRRDRRLDSFCIRLCCHGWTPLQLAEKVINQHRATAHCQQRQQLISKEANKKMATDFHQNSVGVNFNGLHGRFVCRVSTGYCMSRNRWTILHRIVLPSTSE
jgi:hypothetical protein